MSSFIYIHTDGINSKIGITTNLDKRMASYTTHNPTSQLYKKYQCSFEESRQVEIAIKHIFKNQKLIGSAKEWFEVSADEMDNYVSILLKKPSKNETRPSMHGVRLTNDANDIKEKIISLLDDRNKLSGNPYSDGYKAMSSKIIAETIANKVKLAEIFASKFSLGIPKHNLPENVVIIDSMGVDLNHAIVNSEATQKAVKANYIELPHDDHVYNFYHLVSLSTGHYIAICSARVSMPYVKGDLSAKEKQEMVERAKEYGLYCTFHNDWSWHLPDKTGLILYEQKTPISTTLKLWDKSFRKWLIERQEILKNESFQDMETLEKCISDAVHDNTFPLDIKTYNDLISKYLYPFWYITNDDEDEYSFFMKDAYVYLIEKWAKG